MKFSLKSDLQRNYLINVLDGSFFGLAMGFASFTTVIPLFLNTLTSSVILIGLIPALRSMGYQLPPLFMAGAVARQKTFKPMVLRNTLHERLPFLCLALVAFFSRQLGNEVSVALVFLCLVWQGLGGGITANPLQNLIARVFPSEMRGSVIGSQAAAGNLLASGGALAAGFVLSAIREPYNYGVCFLIASVWLVVSYLCLARLRETPQTEAAIAPVTVRLREQIVTILKKDRSFLWFVISKMLAQFSMMASAFYMIYAVRKLGLEPTTAGIMTGVLFAAQVLTNPAIGFVSDRWSRKGVLEIGAVGLIISPILAWLAPAYGWFFAVFILTGISNAVFFTMGLAFLLEYGSDSQRPTYFGLANTLTAPVTILTPLLGGWLAEAAGFQETFLLAAAAGVAALVVLHFCVSDPREAKTSPAL
jgi:MFS family permease